MVGRASATVIRLVPRVTEHDADREALILTLTGLLELAKGGAMKGIVYGAELRGQEFFCDSAGSMLRNPMVALGVTHLLSAEMLQWVS